MPQKVEMSVSRLENLIKIIKQRIHYPKGYTKCLMIMGCQRSGTTFISNVFSQIPYCRVFGEFSKLSDQDSGRIRLNPLDNVLNTFNNCHSPLIVCKPLVESQHANTLLQKIPNSAILWIFRNYRDVAQSDVKKFKGVAGKGNLLPIINNETDNWRNENLSSHTRDIIKMLCSDSLSPQEYAVLFWYARNSLYFDQKLETSTHCTIWSYENFLTNSKKLMTDLFHKLALPTPADDVTSKAYSSSVNKAKNVTLSKEIEDLCENMYQRLLATETK